MPSLITPPRGHAGRRERGCIPAQLRKLGNYHISHLRFYGVVLRWWLSLFLNTTGYIWVALQSVIGRYLHR